MSRWPSLGFLGIVATCAVAATFAAWGLAQPPLDRISELHHELKTGELSKLSKSDIRLLEQNLREHPGLASSLLDDTEIGIISAHQNGWVETPHVTLVRHGSASSGTTLRLRVETPSAHLPLKLSVQGTRFKEKLKLKERGVVRVKLPDAAGAELLRLHFKSEALRGRELRADPSALGVQVKFERGKAEETAQGSR